MGKSLGGLLALSAAVVAILPSAAVAQEGSSVVGNDMPAWSPDGTRIAYVSFRRGRLGDIWTTRPDGRGKRQLTRTAAHEDMPRWSPDGTKIAFTRQTGTGILNFHLFVMNADGSGQTQLTHDQGPNYNPTWSPDGRKIAFASGGGVITPGVVGGGANIDIYVVNADGSGRTRLTTHPARDDAPAWSPNGELIAFESNRSPIGTTRLFVMRPDGSEQRPLTKHPIEWQNEMRPSWSPDGRTVAFVTERDPPVTNSEIYLVDGETGENSRRVTRNFVRDDNPAWSPDGRRFVITRGVALRPEVFVLRTQGGGARKITGVNLRFVRLVRWTKQPRAAKYFVIELVVRPRLDRSADIACYAAIKRNILDVEFAAVRNGRLRCVWFVPRSAKGKEFYGFAGARAGGTQVTRTFSYRVR